MTESNTKMTTEETTMPSACASASVLTEDLGKIFEMGVCLLYNKPYNGKYKYGLEQAEKIKTRISSLLYLFPDCFHTAKNGSRYDFTAETDPNLYLSAKTTKKDGKVCPQVIGQPGKKKFCEYFSLDQNVTLEEIKTYIQTHITNLLDTYFDSTFDCPIVYYNKHKDLAIFIKTHTKINWSETPIVFGHIKKNKVWNESTTISIEKNGKTISIGEFQVHKHRDCIKFRWCFENIIKNFSEHFEITHI